MAMYKTAQNVKILARTVLEIIKIIKIIMSIVQKCQVTNFIKNQPNQHTQTQLKKNRIHTQNSILKTRI